MGGEPNQSGARWESRPVLSAALRAAILLVPALASLGAVLLTAHVVPPPSRGVAVLARLGLLLVVGVAVAAVVERGARRFLPLVVLLKMSMLFPDRAPSRLRTARRARSTTVSSALTPRAGDDATSVADRIVALLAALASHDRRTRGHAHRVHVLADLLAAELGVASADRDRLRWAALLHDIGKLHVPSSVLNKPAKLDDEEWAVMRAHPDEGARLAGPLLGWLGPWGDAIPQHHERFDGTGYPRGLSGAEIAYAGRLVCLVDAFETMTAARPYKKAMATRDARTELAKCAGSHFDPVLVRAFLAIPLPRLLWAGGPLAFLVQLPFLPVIQAGGRAAQASLTAASTGLVAGGAAVVLGGALSAAPAVSAAPGSGNPTVQVTAPASGQQGGGAGAPGAGATPVPTATSTGPARTVTSPEATAPATPTPGTSTGPATLPTVLPTTGGILPTNPVGTVVSAVPTVALPVATVAPSTGPSGTSVTVTVPVLPPVTIKLPKL